MFPGTKGPINPDYYPVDSLVMLQRGHAHAGRLGIICRYEELRDVPDWGPFPVVLLSDGRECFAFTSRQMRRVNL
jgi:hypothetical protein